MSRNKEKSKEKNKFRKILLIILTVIFLFGIAYLSYYFYDTYKNKKDNEKIFENIDISKDEIVETKTERMLQIEELKKDNEEIIGWLEIEGTNINYPVLQGNDNDYYVNHNYKKEKSSLGSIFLDKDFDLENGSSNYLIYGHRAKNGTMFEDIMKYKDEEFYKEHKTIKFITLNEESTYEIIAAFYSRLYYKSEKDVFRYYFFVNAENEQEYNDFVNNAKKISIYDTGITANYGDQLLTLSTCSYHTEDGRFAVVCKKVKLKKK